LENPQANSKADLTIGRYTRRNPHLEILLFGLAPGWQGAVSGDGVNPRTDLKVGHYKGEERAQGARSSVELSG